MLIDVIEYVGGGIDTIKAGTGSGLKDHPVTGVPYGEDEVLRIVKTIEIPEAYENAGGLCAEGMSLRDWYKYPYLRGNKRSHS